MPGSFDYFGLVERLCREGNVSRAMELVNELWRNENSPSLITCTTLIEGLRRTRKIDEAYEIMEKMLQECMLPDSVTFNCLISDMCDAGRAKEANKMRLLGLNKGLDPDTVTYNILISVNPPKQQLEFSWLHAHTKEGTSAIFYIMDQQKMIRISGHQLAASPSYYRLVKIASGAFWDVLDKRCWGSSHGWLVTLGANFEMHLLNPLSGGQISLPPLHKCPNLNLVCTGKSFRNSFVYKVILSASPCSSDCVMFAIYSDNWKMAFAKPGDVAWTPLSCIRGHVDDAMCHDGKFYATGILLLAKF
ncbi:hypothetical protein HAX54_005992 [Datura stramonium]|uniref:KIB1-4 beta-propeller domain-containing protein n=1 Tax=Datura stramonium TaxID=4076 RepID=A0ABS8RIE0_DATST|nr:hypothetical protein [Datura stramonium]